VDQIPTTISDNLTFTQSLVFTPAEKDAYISLFAENLFKGTSLASLDRPLLESIQAMLWNLITVFADRLAFNNTSEAPILDDTVAFVREIKGTDLILSKFQFGMS
jgi:hypothetical protein